MNISDLIGGYSPSPDIISITLCWLILFIIEKVLYFAKDSKLKFLTFVLLFITVGSGANLGLYYYITRGGEKPGIVFLFRDLHHINFFLCMYSFILYMKQMLDVKGKLVNVFSYITRSLLIICALLDILSPFTRIGLYHDGNIWFDDIVSPYNFFYMYGVIILLIMMLFYSNRLIHSVRTCLIATYLVVVNIMLYQSITNINKFTGFTYVLPVVVVMILLHSKPFDEKTGALSSSSFDSFVHRTVIQSSHTDYLILKLNMNMLDTLPAEFGKTLNSIRCGMFKDALLFNLKSDVFVLAVPRKNKSSDTEKKFREIAENELQIYYSQYLISYKFIGLFDIDFIENVSDILGIIKYLLLNMDNNTVLMVDENKKNELRIMKQIKNNLDDIENQNNPEDSRVLVYCQPIQNMKTGKFDTAEALMRLDLDNVGLVMPYLFIPIAESYDFIHTLTRIMLNKVCKEIKKLEEEGFSFKRISVDFTAHELQSEEFCDELFGILKENGVEPSKIGVEITETQSESDFLHLKEKIRIMKNAGMTLYLDDIGTGYSNLDRIVQYNVDVVKFDRFFLIEAEKNSNIIKMITHLSEAFRDLNYELLYEGVETEDHENLCVSCGADYIQGFKYSTPVPISELRNYFERA